MRAAIVILGSILLAGVSSGQPTSPLVRRSQQFTVIDARPTTARSPGQLKTASGVPLTRLDADVLLLCAERIRGSLVDELGLGSDRPGKITLALYLANRPDDLVGVAAGLSPGGWEYRVEIPDQIEPQKLVRGIIHPVLLEFANRGQGPRSAELPLWLVEGMTAHLMSLSGPDLVVGSVPLGSMRRVVREQRGLDYLREDREILRAAGAPSFSELAYPKAEQLSGDRLKSYQAAAHLFVYELLRSPNGPANFVRMLRELPKCWNWEVALLRGFASEFQRMLDVEKKWAVAVLAFTARDAAQVWSRVLSLERLDQVLSVPARVRVAADQLPQRETATLQEVLSEWEGGAQMTILRQKLGQLQVLRYHSDPQLIPLIDSYYRALLTYMEKRIQAGRTSGTRMQAAPNATVAVREAIQELERLDKRRDAFRPEKVLSAESPTRR